MKDIDWWEVVLTIAEVAVPLILILWGINEAVSNGSSWPVGFSIALGGYLLGRASVHLWR